MRMVVSDKPICTVLNAMSDSTTRAMMQSQLDQGWLTRASGTEAKVIPVAARRFYLQATVDEVSHQISNQQSYS